MRWIVFIILTFLVLVLQVTFGAFIRLRGLVIHGVGPDLLAILGVFVALNARSAADAMLAAWTLGFALDLMAIGGPGGGTAVGPMALGYVLASAAVYRLRGALLTERILAQVFITFGFCIIAHFAWVTLQSALSLRYTTWADYARMLLQAAALSVYTALLAPLLYFGLRRIGKLFIAAPPPRLRRAY